MNSFSKKILAYYDSHRRILPWREDPTPYHVWISEIMLQQTRVQTGIAYYERWMKKFPDILSLSKASEQEILKMWEGLGYYSRARNIKKAADQIVQRHAGVFPSNRKDVLALAGIGPYSASAILSIAFHQKEAAIDGNIIRVLSRYLLDGRDFSKQKNKRDLKNILESMMSTRFGDINQALMDLGSSICLANSQPKCMLCPLQEDCQAFEQGLTQEYPKKKEKKKIPTIQKTLFLMYSEGEILLQKREEGLLGGLYEFLSKPGHLKKEEVNTLLTSEGLQVISIEKGPKKTHIFSHKKWEMSSYFIKVSRSIIARESANQNWFGAEEIEKNIMIASAFQEFYQQLKNRIEDTV